MGLSNHREIREGGEIFCPTCGKRWDVNDPYPPKCVTEAEIKRNNSLNQISKLKRMFNNDESNRN